MGRIVATVDVQNVAEPRISKAPVLEPPAQPRPVGIDRGMDVPASFFEPLGGELLDAFEGDDEPA